MRFLVKFIWVVCVILIILVTLPLLAAQELKRFCDDIYNNDMYYGGM